MSDLEYLTVQAALQRVLALVEPLPAEKVPLLESLGRVLAAPISAVDDLPPFANSAMDGYAVRAADVAAAEAEQPVRLKVVADIAAGVVSETALVAGTAARIMTGAPLPEGADAVVPVEDTDESYRDAARPLPEEIAIGRAVGAGDYVRHPGEDIEAGTVVLPAGHPIRPQEIGVLASLGIAGVPVYQRPRIGILATGDELIPVEEPLQPGKIRNSNEYTQTAQVVALNATPIRLGIARDTEEDVRARLQEGLDAGVHLFVSSAGVSVGAYDVVRTVLEQGGEMGFWKVRMRPGKPLAVGRYGGVPYLGLPGNPVSAMVSFERFARPAILKMAGWQQLARPRVAVTMVDGFTSDGRESYIRAVVSRRPDGAYEATTTGSQGSHIMTSLAKANGLVVVPEGMTEIPAGFRLEAMMIDWPPTVF